MPVGLLEILYGVRHSSPVISQICSANYMISLEQLDAFLQQSVSSPRLDGAPPCTANGVPVHCFSSSFSLHMKIHTFGCLMPTELFHLSVPEKINITENVMVMFSSISFDQSENDNLTIMSMEIQIGKQYEDSFRSHLLGLKG